MPLHTFSVESDVVAGEVVMGVWPVFQIKGVSFLMLNDSAGAKVLVTPEETPIPVKQSSDELALKFPKVFTSCAVTQSMTKKADMEVDLSDSLLCDPGEEVRSSSPAVAESSHTSAGVLPDGINHTLSHEQLISWERSDTTLSPLY